MIAFVVACAGAALSAALILAITDRAEPDLLDAQPVGLFLHGIKVYCQGCPETAVLLYQEGSNYASLDPIRGWTTPPLYCPECSQLYRQAP